MHAFARAAAAAMERGFNTTFDAAPPTNALSSSIVRGAVVGAPLPEKSLALLEGALTKILAAFPGVAFVTFRSLGDRWVPSSGSSHAGTAPLTSHVSPDARSVQQVVATWPLMQTLLASALACAAAAAVERGFNPAFEVVSSTYASSSSIVRGAVVGTPLTAKSLASLDGASPKFLAALPGMAFLTFRLLGNWWVQSSGLSRAGMVPPTSHGSPDARSVQRLAATRPLTKTWLAGALACATAAAVECGFDPAFKVVSLTCASSSSIVRGPLWVPL